MQYVVCASIIFFGLMIPGVWTDHRGACCAVVVATTGAVALLASIIAPYVAPEAMADIASYLK